MQEDRCPIAWHRRTGRVVFKKKMTHEEALYHLAKRTQKAGTKYQKYACGDHYHIGERGRSWTHAVIGAEIGKRAYFHLLEENSGSESERLQRIIRRFQPPDATERLRSEGYYRRRNPYMGRQ